LKIKPVNVVMKIRPRRFTTKKEGKDMLTNGLYFVGLSLFMMSVIGFLLAETVILRSKRIRNGPIKRDILKQELIL